MITFTSVVAYSLSPFQRGKIMRERFKIIKIIRRNIIIVSLGRVGISKMNNVQTKQ